MSGPSLAALTLAGLAAAGGGCGDDGEGRSRAVAAPAAQPVVVSVRIGSGPAPTRTATGFAAGSRRVVTVAHVLGRRDAVRVAGAGGGARRARVLRIDRRLDLALLAVPRLRAPRALPGRADGTVRVLVRRDGARRSLRATIRRHVTARVRASSGAQPAVRPAVELAAPVLTGDSGAPVVDARGRVAAVVFARSRKLPGTAYAVDAPALAAFLGAG